MRFCQDHWDRLRAAIEQRGIGHLIAQGGERAAANLKSEIEAGASIVNFDPLMGAHNAIVSNALSNMPPQAAMAMMTVDEPREAACPLCVLNANAPGQPHPNAFDEWIDLAADDAKSRADELVAAEASTVEGDES